jgi:hypothetical protein
MEARGGGFVVLARPSQLGSGLFFPLPFGILSLFFLWTAMVARGDLEERRCREQRFGSTGLP